LSEIIKYLEMSKGYGIFIFCKQFLCRRNALIKALALLSGGLDSTLAVRVILEQGIEVEAINFITVFCNCTTKKMGCSAGKQAADTLGIKLKIVNTSREFLEIVKNPEHGYGRNLNPCIDCRIFMLKQAKKYMQETGARFIITGEVLGERPMSQRRDAMRIIEKESGLEGLILRPLSAKLLSPTIPEKERWVDREKLLSIQGRSRKPQIELASHFGINDYPCPAGGCLLTDPRFTQRMRDLMAYHPDFTLNDVHLLKMGRHLRLLPELKAVVGRNERENEQILTFTQKDDVLFRLIDLPGPITLLRGKSNRELEELTASITAHYSKAKNDKKVRVGYRRFPRQREDIFWVSPAAEEEVKRYQVNPG
jgi:tRNA U34 2-thiouridine synthase MnmA/TrmU